MIYGNQLINIAMVYALRRGRWWTVARWLGHLTSEQLAVDPWISLYQGVIEAYLGRLDEAEIWAERVASRGFAARQDKSSLAESQILQAKLLRCGGRYSESMKLLEEAYPNLCFLGLEKIR